MWQGRLGPCGSKGSVREMVLSISFTVSRLKPAGRSLRRRRFSDLSASSKRPLSRV